MLAVKDDQSGFLNQRCAFALHGNDELQSSLQDILEITVSLWTCDHLRIRLAG
jgi:hypothetical protein